MTISTPAPSQSISARSISDARATLRAHWVVFLVTGIMMVLLGTLALILPIVSSLAVEFVVGWLLLIGGAVRALSLVRKRHLPGYGWSVSGAMAAIAGGLCLVALPLQGVFTLAFVMMALFAIEGLMAILAAFDFRQHVAYWGWTLAGGVVNVGLAVLIGMQWPGSAVWIVGLYAGINLIFIGVPLIATAIGARTLGAT